jgi:hypothetical protein
MPLDLSAITDALIFQVQSAWGTAPIWAELDNLENALGQMQNQVSAPMFQPKFTGLSPDLLAKEGGPLLSLYLYHIEQDISREQLFWKPQIVSDLAGPGQPVQMIPTALNLYYLMSSYAEGDYHQEQIMMSVALRVFHATPIIRGTSSAVPWELCLTMEHRSYDEMSRLWQATTAALRLSVVYRAAVVFLEGEKHPAHNKDVASINVIVGLEGNAQTTPQPTTPPLPSPSAAPTAPPTPPAQELGTFREVSYVDPLGETISYPQEPASAAAGQTVWLMGAHLAGVAIALEDEGGAEVDISSWVDHTDSTSARLVLVVPTAATAPAVGHYSLVVEGERVPLTIAPGVDPVAGAVLTGSPVNLTGAGFVAGATDVTVGDTSIPTASVSVGAGGTSLSFPFTAPSGIAPGTLLPIVVTVAGVEADPALWLKV